MKVRDLLTLKVFEGTEVVAGTNGIKNEVNTVNMMDAPDIIHFLKKNELLVTTAFHFKDDLESLLELIKEMKQQGCSGLGIKTKRFLQEIPKEAVSLADEIELPLLELPVETSLGDIVNKSLSYILDIRTSELHNAMQAHQQFTDHILNGQGVHKLIESLSSLIKLPVVLLNHHLQPAVKNSGSEFLFERLETLKTNGYTFHLPYTLMSSISLLCTKETITLFPVYTHKQSSYLGIIGLIPVEDRSTILTIKQAINVISFELMKENALKQNTRRIQNEFISKFMNGTFSNNEEIISRAKEFGLLNEQRYICAVGKIDDHQEDRSFLQHHTEQDLIYETIELELQMFNQKVHFFIIEQSYILLVELKGGWKDIDKPFLKVLDRIQTKVLMHYQERLSFGISNYAEQLLNVPVSYKEAADALYYGYLSGKNQFIEMYQPKEVPEILRMVPSEQLIKFYNDTFQAFANEPKKDHQTLLHTLSVYLETHCQLSETAKRLYVHRNTVIYRLEKCEEIIGRSLKEADETLRLRLAFRIKALLQGTNLSNL